MKDEKGKTHFAGREECQVQKFDFQVQTKIDAICLVDSSRRRRLFSELAIILWKCCFVFVSSTCADWRSAFVQADNFSAWHLLSMRCMMLSLENASRPCKQHKQLYYYDRREPLVDERRHSAAKIELLYFLLRSTISFIPLLASRSANQFEAKMFTSCNLDQARSTITWWNFSLWSTHARSLRHRESPQWFLASHTRAKTKRIRWAHISIQFCVRRGFQPPSIIARIIIAIGLVFYDSFPYFPWLANYLHTRLSLLMMLL